MQLIYKLNVSLDPQGGAVFTGITQSAWLCSGNPAHRGHPGKGLRRRGGAAQGRHRHVRAHPVRRRRLGHSLKQRRARRLLAALSSPSWCRTRPSCAHTLQHTKRSKQTRPHGRPDTHTQFACFCGHKQGW